MIGDAGAHVGEPGLRVDVVELGRGDRGVHGRRRCAAVGAGEQPGRRHGAMPRSARSAALLLRQMRPSARNRVNAGQRLSI